ncbi:unnamed protein product (macronuclear) [Paramecium tetraurelia]|uniref:Response regulatory domain-containing protein n=1 Tax=Paramecium tetraurelia TaxID=5888 RepID=A0DZ97_PARTE|nr:uncharacterized protein GSPATT00003333001 [Paramecium tetraurelia]CAK88364.1 unnamed protein product [Paramecium tetraurelia]|eukprot:XP_001455761.1 hypothetical protein (macronuclear) [Paramecium tetraurelia strain d4-2]
MVCHFSIQETFNQINIQTLILACINIFLTFIIAYCKIQNFILKKPSQKQFHFLFNLRLLTIVLYFAISNQELSLLLINHLELQHNLKLAILSKLALQAILYDHSNLITLPQNLIFYSYCFFVFLQIGMQCKFNELQSNQQLPQKLTQDAPPTFHAKSQEIKSFRQDELSKSPGMSSSDIKPLQLNSVQQVLNEDDLIMTNMSWLSNQSVLVYNIDFTIVYQTFYLGKLQKNIGDKLDCEATFLESTILIGSKEINELLGQSGFSDSLFSDGSFLLNNLNEVHRCKIKGQFSLRDLTMFLIKDFEKWRFFTMTIFKVKNDFLDLDGIQIKLFVNQIDNHKFILFTLDHIPIAPKMQNQETSLVLQNIYLTYSHESINYVNCILTYILILIHHIDQQQQQNNEQNNESKNQISYSQKQLNNNKDEYIVNCLQNMRYSSQRFTYFLNSMKDYIFYLTNQLFFKMNAIKMEDLLDELLLNFEPVLQLKQIKLTTNIDLQDGNAIIFSDAERIKQIISCLLYYFLQSSSQSSIKLEIKSYTLQGVMITIKDTKSDFDELNKQRIINLTKILNQQLKSQKAVNELDFTNPLELQMSILLCWQLAGSFKRGLEFLIDNQGFCTFTFVIESQTSQMKYQNSAADSGPIKILGKKKYFETSLSLLLQENMNSNNPGGESKLLSFTQLSKQLSYKPTDPIDLQSAYFSQISKIRQETSNSKAFLNSGTPYKQSREHSGSFSGTLKQQIQSDSIQQITRILNRNNLSVVGKIESPHESQQTFTLIDFGQTEQAANQVRLPEFHPKLLAHVIKYRLRTNCCSKVLLLDNDPFSVIVLQKVLQKYDIKCDYCFNGVQAMEIIENKKRQPCHCGNRFYLLYIIDLNIPILRGGEFVQQIKQMMQLGSMDKGFAIATATVVDLNSKLECFRNGMDYFISKPFDLIEISAAVTYLDF